MSDKSFKMHDSLQPNQEDRRFFYARLKLNSKGNPVIEFKHHERVDSLQMQLIEQFVKKAKSNGIELVNTVGQLVCGTDQSYEVYEVTPKDG